MPGRSTPSPATPRLAVLVSGAGTIMEAMIHQDLPIALVLTDRPCRGQDIAEAAGIPTAFVRRTTFGPSFDREAYTREVIAELRKHHITLVALSGFMTILSPIMCDEFPDRILNTHPALLPQFKGAHPVRDALAAGVTETGCTVHIATAELDAGPILAQERVPVLPGDTEATLQERIKVVERQLYPRIIREQLHALAGHPTKK